jgi:hypothetical protein
LRRDAKDFITAVVERQQPHQLLAPLVERTPAPIFLSRRTSLAASANSQFRNLTILGMDVIAFGQMIQ